MNTPLPILLRPWPVGAALIIAGLDAATLPYTAQSPAVYFKANP